MKIGPKNPNDATDQNAASTEKAKEGIFGDKQVSSSSSSEKRVPEAKQDEIDALEGFVVLDPAETSNQIFDKFEKEMEIIDRPRSDQDYRSACLDTQLIISTLVSLMKKDCTTEKFEEVTKKINYIDKINGHWDIDGYLKHLEQIFNLKFIKNEKITQPKFEELYELRKQLQNRFNNQKHTDTGSDQKK